MKRSCFAVVLLALLMGCSEKQPDLELPEVAWTEGERSTDGAAETGEFEVLFETTAGNFTVKVYREWAPRGAERFYQLIKNKYYDGAPFYRVMPGFIVQFGMNGDPAGTKYWDKSFPDDPVVQSNMAGVVCFAKAGPNTRSTQVFINYEDNGKSLDSQGFAPFAEVIDGMKNVIAINPEYMEQPNQAAMARSGNAYVFSKFPEIDYIKKATFVGGDPVSGDPADDQATEPNASPGQ